MTDEDVTDVTRNKKRLWPEVKVAIDLIASAAMIYYATHPDCLDGLGDKVKQYWEKLRHQMSVWATRQSIRTLPETEE